VSDRINDDAKDTSGESTGSGVTGSAILRQRGKKKRVRTLKKEHGDDDAAPAGEGDGGVDKKATDNNTNDDDNDDDNNDDDDDNNNGKDKDLKRSQHVIEVRIEGSRDEHHADDNMVVDNSGGNGGGGSSGGSFLQKRKKKKQQQQQLKQTASRRASKSADMSLRSVAHDTTIKLDMPDFDDSNSDDDDDDDDDSKDEKTAKDDEEEFVYRAAPTDDKSFEDLLSAHNSEEKIHAHHRRSAPSSQRGVDFVQLIARAIVHGKDSRRDGGSSASDSESSEWHDDDVAEERAMKERATRRSKRQRLKDLRYSFSPATFARQQLAGDAPDDSSEESSEVHAELNHYREFLSKTDAVIRKVRPSDDALQILVFGRDRSFKSVTLDSVIAIGNALCSAERARDPIPQTNDVVWIDFCNHTIDDVKQIRLAFGLYPVTVDDCAHAPQGVKPGDKALAKRNDRERPLREKVEFFRRYNVVVTGELDETVMNEADEEMHDEMAIGNHRVGDYALARITIVTMAHVVLTFRQLRAPSFLPLVHRLMRGQHRGVVPSSNWPVMTYFDESLAHLQNLVAEMVDVIDDLNEKVLTEHRCSQDVLLRRLSYARRGLLALRVTTLAKHDLLELMRKQPVFANDAANIGDLIDDINSTIGRLSMAFDVLNHLDDTFLNRINLEVAISGETMNVVMKRFSAVATIFLPLTTIGSIWGMNMYVPGESEGDGNFLAFGLVVGLMTVLALTIAFVLFRNHWF
jgi:Mg2+ and Co2+ transporter CorA